MQTIKVTVIGTQYDELAGINDTITLSAEGYGRIKNGVSYITYNQELLGHGQIKTLLTIAADSVRLTQSGACRQQQEFRLNCRTCSTYVTPYGRFNMAVVTHTLKVQPGLIVGSLAGAKLWLGYALELDGCQISMNTLEITVAAGDAG